MHSSLKHKLRLYKINGECHEYLGTINNRGYGKFSHNGKSYLAHRASYQIYIGNITKGKMICHKCNNRLCINPLHLYEGNMDENSRDLSIKKTKEKIDKGISFSRLFVKIPLDLKMKILQRAQEKKLGVLEYIKFLVEKEEKVLNH